MHRAISDGRIQAEIGFVFSNRAPGEAEGSDRFFQLGGFPGPQGRERVLAGFKRSWDGEPTGWRAAYDSRVADLVAPFEPDLCVLAGYMLIVGPDLCRRLPMINLHPAAPGGPEGTWQEVIWRLIEDGAQESGVKIHQVTEELDRGPTVAYCRYPIRGGVLDELWRQASESSVAELKRSATARSCRCSRRSGRRE